MRGNTGLRAGLLGTLALVSAAAVPASAAATAPEAADEQTHLTLTRTTGIDENVRVKDLSDDQLVQLRDHIEGHADDASELGTQLAERLIARGADAILRESAKGG